MAIVEMIKLDKTQMAIMTTTARMMKSAFTEKGGSKTRSGWPDAMSNSYTKFWSTTHFVAQATSA